MLVSLVFPMVHSTVARTMMKMIRELREERGESRAQLAKALGVMPQAVVDWETGKAEPTISRLRALTEHFGVRDARRSNRPQTGTPTVARRAVPRCPEPLAAPSMSGGTASALTEVEPERLCPCSQRRRFLP
jgi:transcriptional regulator with XRE-family HTH domain